MGLFSKSKSSTSTQQSSTTYNTDKRLAVAENAVGISAEGSTITVDESNNLFDYSDKSFAYQDTSDRSIMYDDSSDRSVTTTTTTNYLDGGAIGGAFDFAKESNQVVTGGLEKILNFAEGVIDQAGEAIQDSQLNALRQVEIVASAKNDQSGGVDQKTIALLVGGAAVAAVVAVTGRGK